MAHIILGLLQFKFDLFKYFLWKTLQAYRQYRVDSHPALQITKKGALDSQPQVIKV
jgi:hypothetical protein